MEITHLVVAGCSWTYCQGLDDPKTQGWPAFLARKLEVPVVNLALPGLGNDAIHRRTYEYFFQDLPNNSKPLYVIAWSQTWRREAWCRELYAGPTVKNKSGYSIIAMPDDMPQNNVEKALLDTWSEEDFYRKTMLARLSIDSLFKSKNIPHATSFFFDPENEHTPPIRKKYQSIVDYLDNNTGLIRPYFYEVTSPYPNLPCGHEGYESMPVLADHVYDYLMKMYHEITPVTGKFMSLKEFDDVDTTGFVESVWK